MNRILVIGASGYIGSRLVPQLIAEGHSVRAASRRPEVLEGRGWDGAELVAADALDRESLDKAMADVSVVYYLAHSMASGDDFAELDRQAAEHTAAAASAAGVSRIIYVGGLQPVEDASSHLRSRRETGDVLRRGSVPVTELRAGIVVGPGSAAFEVIRDLVNHLPVMITPRWVSSRTQPIALRDLLAYLTGLLDVPETAGHTYEVAGPDTLSYADMLRGFASAVGRRLHIVPVPVLSPRLSSYWLDLVTAVPASVARPLIDGLKHDLIAADPQPLRKLIPLELQGYADAVQDALAEERGGSMPARWTEGALSYREGRQDFAFYSKGFTTTRRSDVSAEAVWTQVEAIGGDNGWYGSNILWRFRGMLDRLVGGVGMRRGRRDALRLRVGDALDFWRVAAIEPGRRLTLMAEMRLPGSAVLEFAVQAEDTGSSLTVAAHFHPAGVAGLLYWNALRPVHGPVFRRLAEGIVERAARASRTADPRSAQPPTRAGDQD